MGIALIFKNAPCIQVISHLPKPLPRLFSALGVQSELFYMVLGALYNLILVSPPTSSPATLLLPHSAPAILVIYF